jgi:hypothetical protein
MWYVLVRFPLLSLVRCLDHIVVCYRAESLIRPVTVVQHTKIGNIIIIIIIIIAIIIIIIIRINYEEF